MKLYAGTITIIAIMVIMIGSGHWIISLAFGLISLIIWFIRWLYKFGS
ncbi:MAG TPA: hypothetical protein PLQ44_02945 [Candidatus Paceibacterota bacterium]|nr:hypothetical protein [Candidatus Paceibacterota bacterium]